MEREKMQECPLCGSKNLEHKLGDHVSRLRGTAHNVSQTLCPDCGEIFFGPESLQVIREYQQQSSQAS